MTNPVEPALRRIHERITTAGGDPDAIRIVAAKPPDAAAVVAAMEAGLTDFGENRADELRAKAQAIDPGPRWHFFGGIQRNKIRRIAPYVSLWQTVDRVAVARDIARHAPGSDVLIQINLTDAEHRHGCAIDELDGLFEQVGEHDVRVRGLMAIGPLGPPEDARSGFRLLRSEVDRLGLEICSMGMTDDLEVAVEEGSNMVRIGRALFVAGD